MIIHDYEKTKTIADANAELFDAKLNAYLGDLVERGIRYTVERAVMASAAAPVFTAQVVFTECVKVPENLKDEYELRGETYYCAECPYLNKVEDRRVKYLSCKCKSLVRAESTACLMFYQELARGELKPLLLDKEEDDE